MSRVVIEIINAGASDDCGLRVVVNGECIATGTFGGEPEDNTECRDYSWVKEALVTLAQRLGSIATIERREVSVSADIKWPEVEKVCSNAFYEEMYKP